ncbi:hypothetical protein COT77_01035 [Candidatus Berkelbacteria bacterium CG10_big_fil_rev_8_21_14_0_10_41_12]|uniref:Urease accessory protein UreH-like transmembrane domain-containing protein n=1 Tax=Candidatus Berkelbacteria bacterium CG10_big_fil_rev_8_21_14_0_10_41_12 TaxID=1974513 RepID=A0A2M6WXL3_9BACT|nr:MAG: hypothetical protein COT77_01035 [Candidatus Berkelbacteria bacterium CG10_big_fil_rev_8_21_14_0_10_41_12]
MSRICYLVSGDWYLTLCLGGLFGLLGSTFKLSPTTFSILVVIISAVMILLGLQMLGVKALQKFQISAPKGLTRYIADESHFKGKYMPSILGALTFFLPCGFTITAQSLALISGSFWQGSLIMLTFALGTLPMLAVIGFSSVKFLSSAESSAKFLRVAGTIVVFFALFNINSQMNILGLPSLNDLKVNSAPASSSGQGVAASEGDLPPIVDGKQVVKMEATSLRYTPDTIKVRAEIPVRWEIKDNGTSGCTNAIISKGLFSDSIALTNGQTSVKEFTPSKPGKYKFSCWMGMVSGTIEVVADNSSSSNSPKSNLGSNGLTAGVGVADAAGSSSIVPSGASGCGCGGGAK